MQDNIRLINAKISDYNIGGIKGRADLYHWFMTNYLYGDLLLESFYLSKRDICEFFEAKKIISGGDFSSYLLMHNQMKFFEELALYQNDFSLSFLQNLYQRIFFGLVESNHDLYVKNAKNIENLCMWLNKSCNIDTVKLALDFKYSFIMLRPFARYNKLFARLLFNLILIRKNYLPFYLMKKDFESYNMSLTALYEGDKVKYREIMLELYTKNLTEYLAIIEGRQQVKFSKKLLKIGEFACNVGETKATIRYWTKLGILDAEEVVASGYHYYSDEMFDVVNKIQKLKKQRYSLKQIKMKLGSYA
jgi:hypothetical protein